MAFAEEVRNVRRKRGNQLTKFVRAFWSLDKIAIPFVTGQAEVPEPAGEACADHVGFVIGDGEARLPHGDVGEATKRVGGHDRPLKREVMRPPAL